MSKHKTFRAAIVPSETKGRKAPMTDDEFVWLLERERRDAARQDGAAMRDAMTTERGPGVPDTAMGLRQYLTLVVVNQAIKRPVPDLTDAHPVWVRETVDAIIAEIDAAGYVIVASDRLERLERVATNARAYCLALGQYGELVAAVHGLQPGDLDPGEPGAGR